MLNVVRVIENILRVGFFFIILIYLFKEESEIKSMCILFSILFFIYIRIYR